VKKIVEKVSKKLLHASTRPQTVEGIARGKRVGILLKRVRDRDISLNDLVEERVIMRRVRGGFTDWSEMLRVGQR